MARYTQTYRGERRTASLCVQLTPSERALLMDDARAACAPSLAAHIRALCFRRLGEADLAARPRRNPEARRLAYELSAIGNNLNQLARTANRTGLLAAFEELHGVTGLLKAAMERVIAL
ncbi:MAG TPA: plasmid mobilization relaxosome protein MobC [Rhizomicrobium sp.]|nr:plasmid mobilization relaxosome protein MobC [Rhizomicrobium sp.]